VGHQSRCPRQGSKRGKVDNAVFAQYKRIKAKARRGRQDTGIFAPLGGKSLPLGLESRRS
jgi:hypothetical protein